MTTEQDKERLEAAREYFDTNFEAFRRMQSASEIVQHLAAFAAEREKVVREQALEETESQVKAALACNHAGTCHGIYCERKNARFQATAAIRNLKGGK